MSARRAASAAAALALTATLAACGNNGSGPGGELTYEDSPFQVYWNALYSSGEEKSEEDWIAEAEERQRQQEDLVAQCMADQGFQYNPQTVDFGRPMPIDIGDEDQGPQYGTVEYAEQWGYGVFTWEDQWEEEPIYEDDFVDDWVDPNQDILDAMSDSEQEAWWAALYGEPDYTEWDPDAEWDDWEWRWEDEGCYGWASHELDGDNSDEQERYRLTEDPRFADTFQGMDQIWEAAMTDPERQELDSKWSGCMADAGYTFPDPDAAANSIYSLMEQLWEDMPEDDWEWEPDPALIQQFKVQEIDTAVADFRCRQKFDYENELMRIQFKLEQEYVDNNKAVFDEFMAALDDLG